MQNQVGFFFNLKDAREMKSGCSGSSLPGAHSRCSPFTQRLVNGPFLFPVRKGLHQEKDRKAGRNMSQCMLGILSSIFPIFLEHHTGRQGEVECHPLNESQILSRTADTLLQYITSCSLKLGCEPWVVAISKEAFVGFISRTLLWFL